MTLDTGMTAVENGHRFVDLTRGCKLKETECQ